jgi:hypothetical protein
MAYEAHGRHNVIYFFICEAKPGVPNLFNLAWRRLTLQFGIALDTETLMEMMKNEC